MQVILLASTRCWDLFGSLALDRRGAFDACSCSPRRSLIYSLSSEGRCRNSQWRIGVLVDGVTQAASF